MPGDLRSFRMGWELRPAPYLDLVRECSSRQTQASGEDQGQAQSRWNSLGSGGSRAEVHDLCDDMKPYYQDDFVTLYHGDCREILPTLGKFDLLLTDPPYGIGFSEYESYDDVANKYAELLQDSVFEAETHIDNGWCCVFQTAKKCREWAALFPREWRLIACPKTFVQIFKVHGPTWATDYALLWEVGETMQRGKGRDWKVSDTANMRFDRGHPCARPLEQMKHLVECLSEEGQTILDPFAGSGTTGRAAKDLGRKCTLIEMEEKYCEIAAKRMGQEILTFE
jgi:DNA modification methylase